MDWKKHIEDSLKMTYVIVHVKLGKYLLLFKQKAGHHEKKADFEFYSGNHFRHGASATQRSGGNSRRFF